MKLYVGNLSYGLTSQEIEETFAQCGGVTEVHLPTDRETGRPRGFAFVTMDSAEAMNRAIEELDGVEIDGRNIKDRGGGGGYGGGRDNRGGGDRGGW